MRRNHDLPAGPCTYDVPSNGEGLTKREHIAALVLAGLASRSGISLAGEAARIAVGLADALLDRLARPRACQDVETVHPTEAPPF